MFKQGDHVTVTRNPKINYIAFVREMNKYRGQVVTIRLVCLGYCTIINDPIGYHFDNDWLKLDRWNELVERMKS